MISVSETVSQKKPGRPRNEWLASCITIAKACGCLTTSHTTRHHQNIAYRQRAVGVLGNHPDRATWAWIADPDAMRRGDKGAWQPTLLMELGRIADDDTMIEVARQLSRLDPRPAVKEMVAMVRRFRLGRTVETSSLQLTGVLCKAIDAYVQAHDGTTWEQVLVALRNAIDAVETRRSEGTL